MTDPALFANFRGRSEKLRAVWRWSMYPTMFYRTHLLTHGKRVSWLVEEIAPLAKDLFGDAFDADKATILALVHDDAEIVMGDFQAGHKAIMTPAQLEELDQIERDAIDKISSSWPERVGNYSYKELLTEALVSKSLEGKIVKYLDKSEGLGEALHEVFGGNHTFTINEDSAYGLAPTPFEYYPHYLSSYIQKSPELVVLEASGHPFFATHVTKDYKKIALSSHPHSSESFFRKTGQPFYDAWKSVMQRNTNHDEEEFNNLLAQKEFLKVVRCHPGLDPGSRKNQKPIDKAFVS